MAEQNDQNNMNIQQIVAAVISNLNALPSSTTASSNSPSTRRFESSQDELGAAFQEWREMQRLTILTVHRHQCKVRALAQVLVVLLFTLYLRVILVTIIIARDERGHEKEKNNRAQQQRGALRRAAPSVERARGRNHQVNQHLKMCACYHHQITTLYLG